MRSLAASRIVITMVMMLSAPRARSSAALVLGLLLTGACGGGDGEPAAPAGTVGGTPRDIVIESHVEFTTQGAGGEVLDGSSLGDGAFCPGGTFVDGHGTDETGLVDRTFSCPDGTLRIGFTPGAPTGLTQAGSWEVLGGTGAYDGLRGSGSVEVVYETATTDDEARETFTGTLED